MMLSVLWGGGCAPKESAALPMVSKVTRVDRLDRFRPEPIGRPVDEKPWISHVNAVDLDQDGQLDILACDDKLNGVVWLRQFPAGAFVETTLMDGLLSPVHVEAADMEGDGDLDLLVACMGQVFPNNDRIGSIVLLENDGQQVFTRRVLLEDVARVTDVRAADFDRDGRLDLAVAQFGYDQGEVRWMRNRGDGGFDSHILLRLPGAINVGVADFDGDGTTDIVTLISQQYEEVHLFQNNGAGTFSSRILFGSTNEDFGSSGLSVCDLNRDGRPDIVYTNGDGFAYADPGRRPWHGVQWLENLGRGFFQYHRLGDMPGAYSPVGVDLEGRGVLDIVCVSGFNDWSDPAAASLVVFRNDGRMNFTQEVLAHRPVQLITCAVGDFDRSGRPAIVTGTFISYPPFDDAARINLWRPQP